MNSERYLIESTNVFVINWIVFWKFENNIFKSIPLEPQVQGDNKSLSLKLQVQGRDTLNITQK